MSGKLQQTVKGGRCSLCVEPQLPGRGQPSGKGRAPGHQPGPCTAHTPPIRVTVAGLLLTLAACSHAGGSCLSAWHGSWARGAETSRLLWRQWDVTARVQKGWFVLLKRKKCRDWPVWVLGTEDDITRHAVSFLLGTEEENSLCCPWGS